VLRDHLGMTGTKYGCGKALCGACTVHMDGMPTRSCSLPLSAVLGKSITTIEGLSADRSHPVQKAWIEIDVPQCGYCQSGQIMSAVALARQQSQSDRRGYRRRDGRQHLPLRHLFENTHGDSPRRGTHEEWNLSENERRDRRSAAASFLGTAAALGGGLVLALSLPAACAPSAPRAPPPAGGELNGVAERSARQSHHDPRRSLGNGAGRLYRAADAAGRGTRVSIDAIKVIAAPVGDAYINAGNGGQITGTSNSVRMPGTSCARRARRRAPC
jgi:hypothetical protein